MQHCVPSKMRHGLLCGAVGFAMAIGFAQVAQAQLESEILIDNQEVGDGHLDILTSAYGDFADAYANGPLWPDNFNPSGDLIERFPTFSTLLFLFTGPSGCGPGTHRVALIDHDGNEAQYAGEATLILEITEPNALVGGDPKTCASAFTVTGFNVDLLFELTQHVDDNDDMVGPNGEVAARLAQTYTITNNNVNPLNFVLVKHIDEDMPWGNAGAPGFALDDLVGADFAELEGRPQVFAQDFELLEAAMILRTREDMTLVDGTTAFNYYCAKQSLTPPGNPNFPCADCPAYDYGTDFQIWDNYGTPSCWKNFVPAVGYDIPGISPEISADSHIGLQLDISLGPAETYTVTYETIYGFRPEPTICQPPLLRTTLLDFDEGNNCATFAWEFKNNNPFVPLLPDNPIETFYIDVEAGTGAQGCTDMIGPDGWTVENCTGFDENGHALFKFTDGTPIAGGDKVFGRLIIDANGDETTTNPDTGAIVEPLAVLLHAAQGAGIIAVGCVVDPDCPDGYVCESSQCVDPCVQEDEVCSNEIYTFGPSNEDTAWSFAVQAKAFRPVPSLSAWAKFMLLAVLIGGGMMLVLRSRRPIVA